ncbi:MAG: hypothetical protein ACYDAG_16030 [Chloroflexota bacterium]
MPEYLVTWDLDVAANTPREAAELAWQAMRRPLSIATVFSVIDKTSGISIEVDLTDEEVDSSGDGAEPIELHLELPAS